MSEGKINIKIGPGFATLLTLIFVTLKLTGHITWSWFWVVSPLIISSAIILLMLGLFFCLALLAAIAKDKGW